jgi:hypothetical protein
MSNKDFSKLLNGEDQPSLIEAIAPGLSMSKILSDIGTELKEQGAMGTHELAAALFRNHDAFVLYPRSGKDSVEQTPEHGIPIEPLHKEVEGREM